MPGPKVLAPGARDTGKLVIIFGQRVSGQGWHFLNRGTNRVS